MHRCRIGRTGAFRPSPRLWSKSRFFNNTCPPCSARVKPGMAFRVGVHPPIDEAKLAAPPPAKVQAKAEDGAAGEGKAKTIDVHAMERQMLQRETKPAVLLIDVVTVRWGGGVALLQEIPHPTSTLCHPMAQNTGTTPSRCCSARPSRRCS